MPRARDDCNREWQACQCEAGTAQRARLAQLAWFDQSFMRTSNVRGGIIDQRPKVEEAEVFMSLQELEKAVQRLPEEELSTFARWFEEYLADAFDRRIEADILAGRLEQAGRQADADFDAGRCKPL